MATPNDFVQLIGTDSPDAPGAAYLCSTFTPIATPGNPDSYRVHFNVPEGTQRFCGEAARVRMPRTDMVMLTRFSHSTVMGLPGYVLTSQDAILTGNRKAVTGKTAMTALKLAEGADGQQQERAHHPKLAEGGVRNDEQAAVIGEGGEGTRPQGVTNKQAKAGVPLSVGPKPSPFNRDTTGIVGRVFLVGGPRAAICPTPNTPLTSRIVVSSPSLGSSCTAAEAWWKAMVSMYFHYRVQGVVDLAFVRKPCLSFDSNREVQQNEGSESSLLFVLPLNSDRVNGVSSSDFYKKDDRPLEGATCTAAGKVPPCRGDSLPCCSDLDHEEIKNNKNSTKKVAIDSSHSTEAGAKRAREESDTKLTSSVGELLDSSTMSTTDIRRMCPSEALSRLVAGNSSHIIAIDTTARSTILSTDAGAQSSKCSVDRAGYDESEAISESVASYWCRFPPPPPRFDAKVAKEVFGVNPGPKYASLKKGIVVESDTIKNSDGSGPLVVSLDDVSAASLAASGERVASMWTNLLIVDGDDEGSILLGLEAAFVVVRKVLFTIKKGDDGTKRKNEDQRRTLFGRLSLTMILCPRSADISASLNRKIAELFSKYSYDTSEEIVKEEKVGIGMLARCVSSRAGLLSLEEIEAGMKVLSCQATQTSSLLAGIKEDTCTSGGANEICAAEESLPPSAFPTALAHRYHLNALAGNYFPMEPSREAAGGASCLTTDPSSIKKSDPRHPLALTPSSRVWWPYGMLYRVMDGACLNTPRIDELNEALEREIRQHQEQQQQAEEEGCGGDDDDSTKAADDAAVAKKEDNVEVKRSTSKAKESSNKLSATLSSLRDVSASGGDQDPPLRYPCLATSVEMLSARFKELVLSYGKENELEGVGVACVDTSRRDESNKHTGGSPSAELAAAAPLVDTTVADNDTDEPSPTAPSSTAAHPDRKAKATPSESTNHMLFLGTGSAVPSKYRNVSGLIVANEVIPTSCTNGELTDGNVYHPLLKTVRIICDFGEGSIGQWAQFLGPAESYLKNATFHDEQVRSSFSSSSSLLSPLELALLTTRIMFVSHNHADHVLGIFGLIDSYAKATQRAKKVAENFLSNLVGDSGCEQGAADDTNDNVVAAPTTHSDKCKNSSSICAARAEAEYILSLANQTLLIVCPRNFRDFLFKTVPLLCDKKKDCLGDAAVDEECSEAFSLRECPHAGVRHLLNGNIFTMDLEPLTVTTASAAAPISAHPPLREGAKEDATLGDINVFIERTVTNTALSTLTAQPRVFFEAYLRFYYGLSAAATIIPVDHPAQAHALFFRTNDEWSWCYSGDTRPWPLLNAVAQTSLYHPLRVLVHECTFDDDLQVEAVHKKHSTLSEALGAGVGCGAEHVLLNHFSQRYPKIPPAAAAAAKRLAARARSLERGEQPVNDEIDAAVECDAANSSDNRKKCTLPIIPFTFSFDGMMVPYRSGLHSGDLVTRLPLFQWLLTEYDNWKVGTSQRLRGRRESAATIAIALNKDHQANVEEEKEKRREAREKEKADKQQAALERHKRKEIPKKNKVPLAVSSEGTSGDNSSTPQLEGNTV